MPDPFEQDLIDDQFENDLEYKKIEYPYVEPQVEDAQTIELETQAENDEFSKLKQELIKLTMLPKSRNLKLMPSIGLTTF